MTVMLMALMVVIATMELVGALTMIYLEGSCDDGGGILTVKLKMMATSFGEGAVTTGGSNYQNMKFE